MNIAIIPWDESLIKDTIFIPKSADYLDSHILLRKAFLDRGHDIHTIDMYENIEEVDCFLFFTLNYYWLNKVIQAGMQNKMIYCSSEPAVVKPINSAKGYIKLLKIFPYIMTWNDDLVDDNRIFKRNIPYYFLKYYGEKTFGERKLLVNMSGNKSSKHPKQLYSERVKVIDYFEDKYPEHFDLYGPGWDKKKHPCYKGIVDNKFKTYGNYKFALSLENTYGVKGYISEKIFDCLTAGIVPIYMGAENINEFVPENCYISYSKFSTVSELADYLLLMDEIRYNEYLNNIDKLLDSNIQRPFSSEEFCEDILTVINKGNIKLSIPPYIYTFIKTRCLQDKINMRYITSKKAIKKFITK